MSKAKELLKKRKITLLLIKVSSVLTQKESIEIDGEIKELVEAIEELEEAMQPKTCVGCKYVSQGRYRVPCYTCARILHDEYEPKDNA